VKCYRLESLLFLLVVFLGATEAAWAGKVWEYEASETLTAVEMNHGDTLRFRLRSGEIRTLVLEDTRVQILEQNDGGIVYAFDCQVQIGGHSLTMRRYVCTQESFYEPYVVNGLRIWPDSVLAIYDKIPMRYPKSGNLRYRPRKDARFAIQDATLPICSQEMMPWFTRGTDCLDVGDCYNGDDCWMGAYLGEACHGGMDINHHYGQPLLTPIDFDDQWNFNSLKAGHNNNRWRGVRQWSNGDVWALQTHHHLRLTVPERTPLRAGTHYADGAGIRSGSHNHTHFEFKVVHQPAKLPIDFDDDTEPAASEQPEVIHLDPWILFWQIFETSRARKGQICAAMKPLRPVKTGQIVTFDATESRSGNPGNSLQYYWTFGNGGGSDGSTAQHVFTRPGLYAVTVTVDDGVNTDRSTQLLTVDGEPIRSPALALAAPDVPAFRKRPAGVLDVYGTSPRLVPHTLEFTARQNRPKPDPKVVQIWNSGGGVLASATARIAGEAAPDWLTIEVKEAGDRQNLRVQVDARHLKSGAYTTLVEVDCPGALNSPQRFRVSLTIPSAPPKDVVIVDDRDAGCYSTPYFWVGHKFIRWRRGFGDFYLTNGGRVGDDEFVRFTPDLAAGTYEVTLRCETLFREGTALSMRIRSASGDRMLKVHPAENRVVGTFAFSEGTDGFVEIHAKDSTGLVMADAVEFRRIDE
jgi:PKD domain-containing protein